MGQSQAVKNADNEMCANLLSELVGKERPGGLSDDDIFVFEFDVFAFAFVFDVFVFVFANLLSELVGKEPPGGLSDDDVSMQAFCVPSYLTDLFTTKDDVQCLVVSLVIIT